PPGQVSRDRYAFRECCLEYAAPAMTVSVGRRRTMGSRSVSPARHGSPWLEVGRARGTYPPVRGWLTAPGLLYRARLAKIGVDVTGSMVSDVLAWKAQP